MGGKKNEIKNNNKEQTCVWPEVLLVRHAGAAENNSLDFDWSARCESAQKPPTMSLFRIARALFNPHTRTASNLRGCADASETGIQRAERHQVR